MAGKASFRIEGLAELDKALGELPKATGRNVLHRTLRKGAAPIESAMAANAPEDEGDLKASIATSTKLKNPAGGKEFARVMAAGGTKREAGAAMRAARRAIGGAETFAIMHVGPGKGGAHGVPQEFGTVNHPPQAFARPAWDSQSGTALNVIKDELGGEITKAAARLARKKARQAAKAAAG